jgi:tetratricopeptide (TPR) repeat protein
MASGKSDWESDRVPSPASDPVILAEFADSPPRRRRRWPGVLLILFIIGVVIVPLLFHGFSDELARWRLAAAWEQRLNGDLKAALASLDRALVADPENLELLLQRAAWHLEDGAAESALADCDQAAKLRPDDPRVLFQRSQIFQELDRHDEAIADMEQLANVGGFSPSANLNALAYARAVGQRQLEKALQEVEEALEMEGENAAYLDTRGFIHWQLGNLDDALRDMNKAVEEMEATFESGRQQVERIRSITVDSRSVELEFEKQKKGLAVLRYHRGLVYQSQGNEQAAEADFKRVRELGFEPSSKLF